MTGEEVFLDKINRIEAQRRKTAAGSPKGERSESINRIICMRMCWEAGGDDCGEVLRACFEKFHESYPVNPANPVLLSKIL